MEVLDYWREKEPKFADVDDATLTQFIGDTYPEFLAQPEFKQAYETPIKRANAEDAVGVGVARQNYPELYPDSSLTVRPVFGKPAPLSPPNVAPKPSAPAVDADKLGAIAAMSGGDLSRLSPELRVSLKALNYTPPPGFPKAELGADEVNAIYDRWHAETEQLTAEGHETLNKLKPIPGLKFQPEWDADELKALAKAPKWLRRTAGYMDTAGSFLDFFNSAEGAIMLPLLGAPGAAGVTTRVAVGAQMTEGAFQAVDALGTELAKPESERDEKLIGMLESQIVASVAIVGGIGGKEAKAVRLKYEALAAKHPLPKIPDVLTAEHHPLDWSAGKVADVMGGIKDVFGPPPITAKPGVPYERGQKPAGYRAPFDAPLAPVEAPRPEQVRLTPVIGRAAGVGEERVTDESLQAEALARLNATRKLLQDRTTQPPTVAETSIEPRPWEMEYAGGELPRDGGWRMEDGAGKRENTARTPQPETTKPVSQMEANGYGKIQRVAEVREQLLTAETPEKLMAIMEANNDLISRLEPRKRQWLIEAADIRGNELTKREAKPGKKVKPAKPAETPAAETKAETQKPTNEAAKLPRTNVKGVADVPGRSLPPESPASGTVEVGDTALYQDPSRPDRPPVKVSVRQIRQLANDSEPMAEFDYFGSKRVPVSKLTLFDKSQAAKMRALAESNKASDARTRASSPAAAVAKVQEHVADVATGAKPTAPKPQDSGLKTLPATGPRPAKEIKSELVQRLEKALEKSKGENPNAKITIDIPGDGKFTIVNTPEAIGQVLARAKKLDTTSGKNPAKLPTNRAVDTATGAKQIYGERGAIQKLREQADNPNLEMEESVRQDLRDAAGWLEERLPENVAAKKLEQLKEALDEQLPRLADAEARLKAETQTRKGLKQEIADRLTAKKPIRAFQLREESSARKEYNIRIEVNQIRQGVEAAQKRVAEAEQTIASAKAGKPAGATVTGGTAASPPALGGGDLGKTPPRAPSPMDDPRHSVFDAVPMEMPEAVRMVKALTGLYPKIREKLGRAAGLFRFTQGEGGKGRVELKASIFDLLDANDKARLLKEAENYASATGGTAREQAAIAAERYKFLLDEAYETAKSENPKQAMKVIWHEIGHVVDWLPDHIIRGRGNFFGRIASLKNHLKHVFPLDPKRVGPFQLKPDAKELAQLHKDAYAAMQAEIGPMREIIEKILVEEPIYREAGITPQMVKNIMGMDARETMPELYRWFAEQPDAVKVAVVKSAMKGIVDARLKAVAGAGREQVGTRTVEREVRRREGRPPTPQEVAAKFKELFRAELERRNVADLAALKEELKPLIAWWRGTETMPDYFKTSEEMYAEAFSVFANNPAALEARAPTYAKLLWNYMDRKPQVRALYDQIQADIKSGAIMPDRVKALWEMWDRNDARSLVIARDSLKTRGRDVLDNVQYHFDRRFGPVYRAAKGTDFQGRIKDAVGNFLYRMSEHERYLAGLNESVGKVLVKHNLDWSHDLGEYLFHKRIETERYNMANPLGWTSKNSLERLVEMKATLGPERFNALETAAAEYRAQYEKFVVSELDAAQMFSPDLQAVIQERAHYATFAAVKGIPDVGIERILDTRFGASVTPHIFKQLGNAGEIKNPATATVLKGLSLISAAYRNSMKKEVVAMLQQLHPTDIMPARTRWNGKAREAVIVDNNPGVGTIVYLDKGETKAFYVRRVMSDAVNGASGGDNLAYSLLLNATGYQKALFTQLNYGFWPVNFVRDSMGWMMQMPGALTPLHWAKNLPRALVAARQSVTHSKPNPWADAALRRKMLISKGDPRGVWAAAENEFEVKLASFGMDPVQWKGQHDAVHRLVKAWDFYKNLGQTFERVNKISGMLYLDEKFPTMPEWKKREIIRERSGSPNFLERGASNPAIDLVALFYNPWKEGVRTVMKSAKENPASFAAKATVAVLLPTILQSAAVNGWLGEDRKEQYASIPDFDLTNYLVVPLGWVDRKARKVAYLRLPLWEPARIAHGTTFQGLTDRGQGIAAHAGGQLPGLNPLWKIGLAWASYAQGKNPMDSLRGVPVMPQNVFDAGGPATLAEMGKYSWNEAGGSILWRFRNLNLESSPASEGEKLLAFPGINNALGRWIKVSDRGLADQQRSVQNELAGPKAEIRLGVDEILRRMTGEGSWDNLQRGLAAGDDAAVQRAISAAQLSDAERMLMRDPYAQKYFATKFPELVMSKANVNAKLWFDAKSNEERAKLIERGIIQPTK